MVMSNIDKWPIILLYSRHTCTQLHWNFKFTHSLHRQTPKLVRLTQTHASIFVVKCLCFNLICFFCICAALAATVTDISQSAIGSFMQLKISYGNFTHMVMRVYTYIVQMKTKMNYMRLGIKLNVNVMLRNSQYEPNENCNSMTFHFHA